MESLNDISEISRGGCLIVAGSGLLWGWLIHNLVNKQHWEIGVLRSELKEFEERLRRLENELEASCGWGSFDVR